MRRVMLFSFLLICIAAASASATGPLRERLRARAQAYQQESGMETMQLAGLTVAYWLPRDTGTPASLILFSHGLGGCKSQSVFLMAALAQDGYVVVAPDHQDASCGGSVTTRKPKQKFTKPEDWTDQTYADRGQDIQNLYAALKEDKGWAARIDWNRVGLAGHSLGGYTALALGGAWPSWKMEGVKAVLALSPYAAPFLTQGNIAHMGVPVMYQGGTRDFGITPSIKKENGIFDKASSPAWFVEFNKTGHFGFTDLQKGAQQGIIDYSLWFFDHTLKGSNAPLPQEDVADLREK